MDKIKIAGYVKLAKLWNINKEKAIKYHNEYYINKYINNDTFEFINVYIDITGKKEIYNRPEMIRLLSDCLDGKINCVATQTKGYLAANMFEMCFLLLLLFDADIDIITEDESYNINTLENNENQKNELYIMAKKYAALNIQDYTNWNNKVFNAIKNLKTSDN